MTIWLLITILCSLHRTLYQLRKYEYTIIENLNKSNPPTLDLMLLH